MFENTRKRHLLVDIWIPEKPYNIIPYSKKKGSSFVYVTFTSGRQHLGLHRRKKKGQAEINTFYNLTKGGVDGVDKLYSSYSVSHIKKKVHLQFFMAF